MRYLAVLLLALPRLFADGGAVQLRQESGPFVITVFASPSPARAGPVDISVLVQDRATLRALLDADVSLHFAGGASEIDASATRAQAQNKLLYAANLNLPVDGSWRYSVSVHRGQAQGIASGSLSVAPAAPAIAQHWGSIAFAPLCILIFALHQTLKRPRLKPIA